jgi:hypothetical protein
MWWCSLHKCKALTDIKSVCDLGVQELIRVDQDIYDKTSRTFVDLCGEPNVSLADCQSSADMWRRLKREIVSLDMVGNDASVLRFDLNIECVPAHLKEHFDFVTNAGTTEHVFNQANCFKVVHDLTKVNGVMAHTVPFAGYDNHGLFKYTMKFFTRIAKANDYDCLDAWLPVDPNARKLRANLAGFFGDDAKMFRNARSSRYHPIDFYNLTFDDYRSADECIYVFLRKTNSTEFCIPVDFADA